MSLQLPNGEEKKSEAETTEEKTEPETEKKEEAPAAEQPPQPPVEEKPKKKVPPCLPLAATQPGQHLLKSFVNKCCNISLSCELSV